MIEKQFSDQSEVSDLPAGCTGCLMNHAFMYLQWFLDMRYSAIPTLLQKGPLQSKRTKFVLNEINTQFPL